jgi:transposase
LDPKKIIILLDNASSHKTSLAKAWASETGVILLFNIPYTPMANPIELFFGNLKQRCKAVNTKTH